MSDFIDISLPVSPDLVVWPNSLPITFEKVYNMAQGDQHTDTDIHLSVHAGTHIDAPAHFIRDGKHVSDLPLEKLMGLALVVGLPDIDVITANDMETLAIPSTTRRLLIKTKNSQLWAESVGEFKKDFVAIRQDAAQWIVDRGIELVAVDYLSVQPFLNGPETHHILLGAEVVVVEGVSLAEVTPGEYELICLPMRLINTEGAPVRALLRKVL